MSRRIRTGVLLVLFGGALALAPARAGDAPLSADLAWVPADGVGFLHVRLGDLFKSEHFKEWRETLLKASDEVLAAFDRRVTVHVSSVPEATLRTLITRARGEAIPNER